jgi:hypothetical protein
MLDALLDEGPFEERIRRSEGRASTVDLAPIPTAPDENEAVIEAVLVRPATSGWLATVMVDNSRTGRLAEHCEHSIGRRNLSVELRLRHRDLEHAYRTQIYKTLSPSLRSVALRTVWVRGPGTT